jgi:hypothetical protein
METQEYNQDQMKEVKEGYEQPKITTYTEDDIMNQYKVVGFSF